MKDKRKAFEAMIHGQLKEWDTQITLLKARADKGKAEVKIEYIKTFQALRRRQEKARA
ncbi:MAG TPA: hypothetical protein VMU29_06440 [Smithella sp.]|nr:hypothetical protein [Smithella sp.]